MDPRTPSKEQCRVLQKRVEQQQQQQQQQQHTTNGASVKLNQAASAYYFGTEPKTPSVRTTNNQDTTPNSSSSSNDAMNLSMLSDTTELTASNFVFAASARQRWTAFHQNHNKTTTTSNIPVLQPSLVATPEPTKLVVVEPLEAATPDSSYLLVASSSSSSNRKNTTTMTPMSNDSPLSMRSRIVADVGGMLRLQSSLKKGKQRDTKTKKRRSSSHLLLLPPSSNPTTENPPCLDHDNKENSIIFQHPQQSNKSRRLSSLVTVDDRRSSASTGSANAIATVFHGIEKNHTQTTAKEDLTEDSAVSFSSLNSLFQGLEGDSQKLVVQSPNASSQQQQQQQMLESPTRTRSHDFRSHSPKMPAGTRNVLGTPDSPARNTRSAHRSSEAKEEEEEENPMIPSMTPTTGIPSPARITRSRRLSLFESKEDEQVISFRSTTQPSAQALSTSPSPKRRVMDTSNILVFDSPAKSTRLQKTRLVQIMSSLDESVTKSVASSNTSSSSTTSIVNNGNTENEDTPHTTYSDASSSSMMSLFRGLDEMTNEDASAHVSTTIVFEAPSRPSPAIRNDPSPMTIMMDSPARNTRSSHNKRLTESSNGNYIVNNTRLTAETSELRSLLDNPDTLNLLLEPNNNVDCAEGDQPTVDFRDFHDLFDLTTSSLSSIDETTRSLRSRRNSSGSMLHPKNPLATITEGNSQDMGGSNATSNGMATTLPSISETNDPSILQLQDTLTKTTSDHNEEIVFSRKVSFAKGGSIYNSGKKTSRSDGSPWPRKSVAFGSPEGAEYNLGSPSVSMTPIPHEKAKVLFNWPLLSAEQEFGEESCNSKSPRADGIEESTTTTPPRLTLTQSPSSSSDSKFNGETEDNLTTMSLVPLEGSITALLANAQKPDFGQAAISSTDDIRGTLQPVNLHRRSEVQGLSCTEKLSSLQADCEIDVTESGNSYLNGNKNETISNKNDEDYTVEIETDVFSFLAAAGVRNDNRSSLLRSGSIGSDVDMDISQDETSFHGITDSSSKRSCTSVTFQSQEKVVAEDFTMDLEHDVASLIKNTQCYPKIGSIHNLAEGIQENYLLQVDPEMQRNDVEAPVLGDHAESPIDNRLDESALSFAENQDSFTDNDNHTKTIELDKNLESLIEACADDALTRNSNAPCSPANEAPESLITRATRRSPSHFRLSLSARKRSSFSSIATSTNIPRNQNTSSSDEETFQPSEFKEITPTEVLSALSPVELEVNDFFLDSCRFASNTTDKEVLEATSSFIIQASTEIEQKVSEQSQDCPTKFVLTEKDQLEHLSTLKTKLCNVKDIGNRDIVNQLNALAKAVHIQVANEWSSWELEVTEALLQTINISSPEIDEEEDIIERRLYLAEKAHESVVTLNRKVARQGRRRSLSRRKNKFSTVTEAIQELEVQLQELAFQQKSIQQFGDGLSSLLNLRKSFDLDNKIANQRISAEAAEKTFKIQEGLLNWLPILLNDERLIIKFFGRTKYTVIELTVTLPLASEPVLFEAAPPFNDLSTEPCNLNYSSGSMILLKHRVNSLCSEINAMQVPSIADLYGIVPLIDWKLWRLELICSEISTLQSKFETTLEHDTDDTFVFAIDFSGKKIPTRLRVSFDLNESYPNAPIDIFIEPLTGSDKIDIKALSRHLLTKVYPGFGYASRLCDVIKSYLD